MMRRKKMLVTVLVSLIVLGGVAAGGVYLWIKNRAVDYAAPEASPGLQTGDLQTFREQRVYFGHQSVGQNILDGIKALYGAESGSAPTIQEVTTPASVRDYGPHLLHSYIGENGQPDSKLSAFAAMMRSGMAERVDVALMKLCYVDFGRRTDTRQLFDHYRTTMAALERDFPKVTFVYTTVPLTTTDPYLNSVRTQFNSLVRSELRNKPILDIAEIESRGSDGSHATGTTFGLPYEQLQPQYASDGAHLNTEGAQRVAAGLIALVNRVNR